MKYLSLNIPGYGPVNAPSTVRTGNFDTFQTIIRNGIVILIIVALILATLFLIWGGIDWISSGGGKEGLEKAKKKITFAIIGLVVTLLAFFIISVFGGLFGINYFNN